MVLEIKAPSPGESISEVELANWLIEDGGQVEKDQEIAEIESGKSIAGTLISIISFQYNQLWIKFVIIF